MNLLPLTLAGGILVSGIAAGTTTTEQEQTLEEKLAPYQQVEDGAIGTSLKDLPQELVDELEETYGNDDTEYKLYAALGDDNELKEVEVRVDEKTGIQFFKDSETGEYTNQLGTLKTDINTGEIFDAETGDLLTTAAEISERLWTKVEGGMQISRDDIPDQLFDLMNEENPMPDNVEYEIIKADGANFIEFEKK
ncbi:hypothetical protein [Bacillus solimangrovi]|uniref:Uncharacterized protein n=1 Tax=Bacillus solimangrovi TaxID=1305675 RepID=A0A1E5LD08_9BACI|nr:hypothetical protein [Bacillus solimangrovi]OEH91965.1 hypothetical protein BFG57_17420 [Bacillus solimangrovi]